MIMQQRIYFNSRDKLIRLDTQKIVYFEGDGNYTYIVTANKQKACIEPCGIRSVEWCVSMSRFLALLLICFIATSITYAQDFKVTTFEKYPLDLTAAFANIKDRNGDVCALIKFSTRDEEFEFEPNLGIVKTEKKIGETLIYVPKGTKRITIRHPRLGVLRHYTIPVRIEEKTV